MTLIMRTIESGVPYHLGGAGLCRVGLAEVVGAFGSGRIVRVVFLGDWGVELRAAA